MSDLVNTTTDAEREEKRRRKQEKKAKRDSRRQRKEDQKNQSVQSTTESTEQVCKSNGSTNGEKTEQNGEDKKRKKEKKSKKRNREENGDQEPEKKKLKTSDSNGSTNGHANGSSNGKSNVSYISDNLVELDSLRDKHGITVDGDVTSWKYFQNFIEAGFPSALLEVTKNFKQPTPIQAQCWPIVLSGRDIVGIAETGSGKTLAFGLPGIAKIMDKAPQTKNPLLLVLAPTRELAIQSSEVLIAAGKTSNVNGVCIYGGGSKAPQKTALRAGAHVIVATPGRLLDLVNEGECNLSEVSYLVLDEADRMLDLGFEKDIRTIIGMTPATRQTLMFSATWPQEVQKLASQFLNNPIKVTIGTEALTANKNVQQIVEVIEDNARKDRLLQLLSQYHKTRKNKVLVFVLYKKEATYIENFLRQKGWTNASIHGDKSQTDRLEALAAFTTGKIPLLIATDVAARGLDIPKVEYVINYSFPLTIQDYVHRIGRTGRAGAKGISHTFFQQFDKKMAGELVGVLRESNQQVPEDLLKFGVAIKKKEPKLGKISQVNESNTRITFDSDEDE
jgi:ATP-dependent RNA helicase DBP3